ncbi:MAG: FAD-dependent oxidoreductase, partial [Gammaproteobacteria bacterium]|nr:FAD-dependent oxidoreductase [Gammaproteobacteria bacterium]
MNEVDVVVIGAGIHGAGVAQAAAAAGYSVLVIEKNDIGTGTSSKSSKLIHGGLRYLESYQFSLVRKSLKERAVLCRIAPELVKLQPFYIPVYKNTTRRSLHIRTGLILYALLGGLHKNNLFKRIRRNKTGKTDGLKQADLQHVYRYFDGQTNDQKLTEAVMRSAQQLGSQLVCRAIIHAMTKTESGYSITYTEENKECTVKAKVVVNASGPWVNEVHNLLLAPVNSLDIDLVQGTHIIIDVPAPSGIYYLEAQDQRAVFVMPYEFNGEKKTMVGTTEKLFLGKADDVKATDEEVDYLLNIYKTYFIPDTKQTTVKVIQQFAG